MEDRKLGEPARSGRPAIIIDAEAEEIITVDEVERDSSTSTRRISKNAGVPK